MWAGWCRWRWSSASLTTSSAGPTTTSTPQDAALKYSYLERLEFVSLVQQTIDKELGPSGRDLVGPSLSAVTFAPPLPTGNDLSSVALRSVTNSELEEQPRLALPQRLFDRG